MVIQEARGRVVAGTFFHTPSRGVIEVLEDALLSIDERGAITAVALRNDPDYRRMRDEAATAGKLESLPRGCYVLPGFVDLHIHAPQYPQLGKALDCPLEDWLERYTFPLQARFADLAFARRAYAIYRGGSARCARSGGVMYGTIDKEPNRHLLAV